MKRDYAIRVATWTCAMFEEELARARRVAGREYVDRMTDDACGPVSTDACDAALARAMKQEQTSNGSPQQQSELFGRLALNSLRLWSYFGFPTFRLTHGLTAALSLTDTRVAPAEAGMPYPAFRIEIGDGILGHIQALHVGRFSTWTGLTREREGRVQRQAVDRVMLTALQAPESLHSWRNADVPVFNMDGEGFDATEHAYMLGAWRIVLNLCAYLAEHKAEASETYRSVRAAQQANGAAPAIDVWELGREIKLTPAMREAARICNSGRAGFELTKRFIVRGHWREQPCGPGRAERKRIWVQPFWKGPADGVALLRNYSVGA